MFVELIRSLRFIPTEDYQYIGFGSVGFVDFRLFFRALGIQSLVSIEDTMEPDEQERFLRNVPHACIDVKFGSSATVLPTLDLNRPTIAWLDYDNAIRRSMVLDLAEIAGKVPSGSLILVSVPSAFSVNRSAEEQETEATRLKQAFPEHTSPDATARTFSGRRFSQFVYNVFHQAVLDAVADANAGVPEDGVRRRVQQVCLFEYKDGLPMMTVGWLIVAEGDDAALDASRLTALAFYRDGATAYKIDVPIVTPFEIREMERRLPGLEAANDLDWIPSKHRRAFAKSARYLPNYVAIEGG